LIDADNKGMSMNQTLVNRTAGLSLAIAAALALSGVAAAASAETAAVKPGCVSVKTVAQVEEEYLDERGHKARRLVAPAKVVPGTEVIWTVTASNICAVPATNVQIDNPVPQHMSYVAQSAFGPGADISYSLDGRRFAAPEQLTVRADDGAERRARPEEYSHLRWALKDAIAPGAVAIARFRATVK
jgi:uncharacterized repeat protein (TIGR01451 family)